MRDKQDDVNTSRFMLRLAALSTVLFFAYVFCITFIAIPEKNSHIVDIVLGFLSGTLISTIYNYYFGSSASSKSKDKTIQDMSSAAVPATVTEDKNCTDGDSDGGDSDGSDTTDDNSTAEDDDLTPPVKG